MPRVRTGQVRYRGGKWFGRITLTGKVRPSFELPTVASEAEATKRTELLAHFAGVLRDAGQLDLAMPLLEKTARADTKELPALRRLVKAAAAGHVIRDAGTDGATFRQVATAWTSGDLARRFPHHVKVKRSADSDVMRLDKHIYPLIADVPIADFTLDHAEVVMGSLAAGMSRASRRHIAQLMHRVLALAVFPLRLRPATPLPRGWLPKLNRTTQAFLYPDEDMALLSCADAPLARRFAFGFLAREGMRKSEALRLTWADVDLSRGVVSLDANKTDDPRAWRLGPDVAIALRRWHEHCGSPDGHAPVLADRKGSSRVALRACDLRDDLKRADVQRPQLFEQTTTRRRFNVHGLRATFVTLALAAGQSEAWVTDRTGHRSSAQLHGYKRPARGAADLGLGWLAPLHLAIPELRIEGETAPEKARAAFTVSRPVRAERRNRHDLSDVRERGLEPPHLAILDPKAGWRPRVSATWRNG
jgi:integrase